MYRGKIKSSEIAELKDKLNVLLVDSTDMHPLVRQLREQINSKMAELKKENLDYTEEARLSAESTNPMIDQIKKTLDTIADKAVASPTAPNPEASEQDLYKVMLIDKLDTVMARDVGVNNAIYNSLLQRLETAKITQRLQSSKEGTKYVIVDPPRVPLMPTKPNGAMVVFMGLFLGTAAGAGLIFVYEFLDKSFLDVQEASTYLGVPLLGAISKIHTEESIYDFREKNKWILFCMTSIGILLVAFTVMFKAFFRP